MAKCIDCLHFEVCKHKIEELCKWTKVEDLIHNCSKFKDRTSCVEVVRCKDCKHFIQAEHGCNHFGYYSHTPWVDEVDFCSYGEKRDGDGNG